MKLSPQVQKEHAVRKLQRAARMLDRVQEMLASDSCTLNYIQDHITYQTKELRDHIEWMKKNRQLMRLLKKNVMKF